MFLPGDCYHGLTFPQAMRRNRKALRSVKTHAGGKRSLAILIPRVYLEGIADSLGNSGDSDFPARHGCAIPPTRVRL
jgi:hypothetical protein